MLWRSNLASLIERPGGWMNHSSNMYRHFVHMENFLFEQFNFVVTCAEIFESRTWPLSNSRIWSRRWIFHFIQMNDKDGPVPVWRHSKESIGLESALDGIENRNSITNHSTSSEMEKSTFGIFGQKVRYLDVCLNPKYPQISGRGSSSSYLTMPSSVWNSFQIEYNVTCHCC